MLDPRQVRVAPWRRGALTFVAVLLLFDLVVLRAGVPDPLDDSWEYGVVARSISAGHGLRTSVIHPPLWRLVDAQGTVPVLVHGPLLPIVLAPLVKLFGRGAVEHMAWLGALFAWLAAMATFDLGTRLVSASVGGAAAGLLAVSPLTLRAVHHDPALLAGAWLLALALDLLTRKKPRGMAAGFALGLGALARPEFVYAAPLMLPLAVRCRARFALAFAAVIAPWAWHGWANAGSPWFNLSSYLLVGYSSSWPGISAMRDFALAPAEWPRALREQLPHLPAKWWDNFPHALKRLLTTPTDATGWLVPLGLLFAFTRTRVRVLAGVCAALALLPLAIMTLTLYDARYLTPFLPAFALGGALGAAELAEWLPPWLRRQRAWIGALVLLVLPSTGTALNEGWREARVNEARLQAERAALLALPHRGEPAGSRLQRELVYSDTPDFVAWTTGRPALWISAAEYRALPAWDPMGPPALSFRDRPRRTERDVLWFHANEGRGPVLAPDTTVVVSPLPTAAKRR